MKKFLVCGLIMASATLVVGCSSDDAVETAAESVVVEVAEDVVEDVIDEVLKMKLLKM